NEVAPEAAPALRIVRRPQEVEEAVASFGGGEVAVKPSGLTGGKGVKVMGPHLASHADARDYALELLARGRNGESVLIEEKIRGAEPTLPFMSPGHYSEACSIIERVIERLSELGRHFSGVMNSGFFATADGVRVIEFNARFGDPECMNIMSLFAGDWPAAMESISAG